MVDNFVNRICIFIRNFAVFIYFILALFFMLVAQRRYLMNRKMEEAGKKLVTIKQGDKMIRWYLLYFLIFSLIVCWSFNPAILGEMSRDKYEKTREPGVESNTITIEEKAISGR